MQFGDARWSLGGPGWSQGAARRFPGGFGEQNECFRNGVFGPLVPREGVLGVPTSIIVRNWTPSGARLARKVFWDDNLAPLSSDKIQAKILVQNLRGFYQRQSQLIGGQVLGPTILPPAGVRQAHDNIHSRLG